ncbi:MAG TPA: hypothetical protein VLV16_08385 [Gemmatimonadales bacterium]|nr:hypothetical protein [Gemmatimonadales bacterium]
MRIPVLLAALLWLGTFPAPGAAQLDSPSSRKTLGGLPGFYVAVEDMDTSAARVGVTATMIQADVESKLRTAGIKLYTQDDFKNILEVPQLYINVNELALHGAQAGLFTYNATAEVRQAIKLSRDASIASTSVTWRAPATVGTVGSDNFYTAVRNVVREQVDLLITAYREANP